ncbi:cytidine deaminase [Nocardioides limicola]|uniref:cytidine deaminase n=1 Tax=Nocardioides limicola TaxID=2803368 RepID=UPI00193AFD12|nr:cytidine deaminase [Nocardioides sp. DJM-14]
MTDAVELSAEDTKLVTLARATRARVRSEEAAAVRDQDGRTYAAATVDLPSLKVSAIAGCVVMALAAGATTLEAVVVLGEHDTVAEPDVALVREFGGTGIPVHHGDPRGRITGTLVS